MNFFRLAFELFALYLLYKLVFDLIIPVMKTTKDVKKQFRHMSEEMRQNRTAEFQQPNTNGKASSGKNSDDYIEFEEIK